jgi:hypothetical protein
MINLPRKLPLEGLEGGVPTTEQARDAAEAGDLAELIQTEGVSPIILTHDDVVKLLNTPPGKGARIVFMQFAGGTDTDLHAEQQLVRALIASNAVGESVTIRGAKRPCAGCSLALRYAQEQQGATNLHFDPNPGIWWQNSVRSAVYAIEARPGDLKTPDEREKWVKKCLADMIGKGFFMTQLVTKKEDRVAADRAPRDLSTKGSRTGITADAASFSDSDSEQSEMTAEVMSGGQSLTKVLQAQKKPTAVSKGGPAKSIGRAGDDSDSEDAVPAPKYAAAMGAVPKAPAPKAPAPKAAAPKASVPKAPVPKAPAPKGAAPASKRSISPGSHSATATTPKKNKKKDKDED